MISPTSLNIDKSIHEQLKLATAELHDRIETYNALSREAPTLHDYVTFMTANEVLPELMNQIDPKNVSRVTGDGAYDDKKCFAWAEETKLRRYFLLKKVPKFTSTEIQKISLKWGIS